MWNTYYITKKIKQLLINYLFTYLNININSNFEIMLQFLKISEKTTKQTSFVCVCVCFKYLFSDCQFFISFISFFNFILFLNFT